MVFYDDHYFDKTQYIIQHTTSKFGQWFLQHETKLPKILHRKTQSIPETSKSGRIHANSFWRKSYIDLKLTNFGEFGDFYLSNFPILGLPKKPTLIYTGKPLYWITKYQIWMTERLSEVITIIRLSHIIHCFLQQMHLRKFYT